MPSLTPKRAEDLSRNEQEQLYDSITIPNFSYHFSFVHSKRCKPSPLSSYPPIPSCVSSRPSRLVSSRQVLLTNAKSTCRRGKTEITKAAKNTRNTDSSLLGQGGHSETLSRAPELEVTSRTAVNRISDVGDKEGYETARPEAD